MLEGQALKLETGAIPLAPFFSSVPEQEALLAQFKRAGVRLIRVVVTPEFAQMGFAKRAFEQGIRIEAIVGPQFPKSAKAGAGEPEDPPQMFGRRGTGE